MKTPTSPHIDLQRSVSPPHADWLFRFEAALACEEIHQSSISQPVTPRGAFWEEEGLHGLLVFTARSLTQIILLSAHIYMSSLTLNMHRNDVMTYRPSAANFSSNATQEDTNLHDLV